MLLPPPLISPLFLLGTMRNWLHYCNFSVTETKKSIYFDGHEREDVIQVIIIFEILIDMTIQYDNIETKNRAELCQAQPILLKYYCVHI